MNINPCIVFVYEETDENIRRIKKLAINKT